MFSAAKAASRVQIKLLVQGFLRSQADDYRELSRELMSAADLSNNSERAELLVSAARQHEKADVCLEMIRELSNDLFT